MGNCRGAAAYGSPPLGGVPPAWGGVARDGHVYGYSQDYSGGYCVTVDQPMERRAFYVFDGVFSSLPRRGVDKARLFVFSAGSVFVHLTRPFLLRFAGRKNGR